MEDPNETRRGGWRSAGTASGGVTGGVRELEAHDERGRPLTSSRTWRGPVLVGDRRLEHRTARKPTGTTPRTGRIRMLARRWLLCALVAFLVLATGHAGKDSRRRDLTRRAPTLAGTDASALPTRTEARRTPGPTKGRGGPRGGPGVLARPQNHTRNLLSYVDSAYSSSAGSVFSTGGSPSPSAPLAPIVLIGNGPVSLIRLAPSRSRSRLPSPPLADHRLRLHQSVLKPTSSTAPPSGLS